jgi:serine/threonine-protein kinase
VHAEVCYELGRRLGGGASGEVFLARARGGGIERFVCVKRLATVLEEEEAAALREEARLLSSVRHANVVSLLAFGEEPSGAPFLVLELVDGLDLRALCQALGPGELLPDQVAVHVACAVLRALGAVQRSLPGLVHRDVTPHNVLVSTHGEVKLGDFGIALARDRSARLALTTRPRFVKGKLGYMSPEQILGAELDVRSDVFAVGVLLYELLTGSHPWDGWRSWRGVHGLRAIVEQAPVALSERRADLDRALAGVVARLIERRPDARFPNADAALRALAPFGAGEFGSLRLSSLVGRLRSKV